MTDIKICGYLFASEKKALERASQPKLPIWLIQTRKMIYNKIAWMKTDFSGDTGLIVLKRVDAQCLMVSVLPSQWLSGLGSIVGQGNYAMITFNYQSASRLNNGRDRSRREVSCKGLASHLVVTHSSPNRSILRKTAINSGRMGHCSPRVALPYIRVTIRDFSTLSRFTFLSFNTRRSSQTSLATNSRNSSSSFTALIAFRTSKTKSFFRCTEQLS